tara:strand:- start:81 stop:590 length:510 start_codon:yes stop_codon:yes gene_type:complete
MGTTTIDVIQSAQITALQADVVELKDKLNACVAELNKCVTEITSLVTATNTLKTNVEDINTRITNNYSGGGGSRPSSDPADGILKRIADAEGDITALQSTPTSSVAQPKNINSTTQGTVNSQSQTSTSSSSASVTGVYTAQTTSVLTIQDNSATRAREVARSTLASLRR